MPVYRFPNDEIIKTIYCDAPSISIFSESDAPVRVVVEFTSSIMDEDRSYDLTRVDFGSVLDYRWSGCEVDAFLFDAEVYEHALIELEPSEYKEALAEKSLALSRSPGRRFGEYIPEEVVRHYRLGFDEYGTFDIVCLRMTVTTRRQTEP